ncbi:diguanylate cyclase domain-containing protein [Vibrio tapetis]|uniref:diguanylate cyclase n=1 Tax=Vibrio tapetis subsp. tapetis TaxID=1671868 RepID=A0A2N8ZK22_9VIBR|nr:diguanylate cyclase [Vibrio tapetis]SON52258.1 putative Methyl-accepting chemotaxis protein fused with GGDEF domain [Vibrio tapetis subsp. tapetis]
MALPKFLIKFLRPLLITLIGYMVLLAYQQLNRSEEIAIKQSHANLRTASVLIDSHIESTINKFFILEQTWLHKGFSAYQDVVKQVLLETPTYSDIILHSEAKDSYTSLHGTEISSEMAESLSWHKIHNHNQEFEVSTVYEKEPGHWVFAIRHSNPKLLYNMWIEFDLLYVTQHLQSLKTLQDGYLFIVDQDTQRLIYHPDAKLIGKKSIAYLSGIEQQILEGNQTDLIEYYYKDNFKLSVFDSNNNLGWVYVSGTDRADIMKSSAQFSLTAAVLFVMLLLFVAINYLLRQLNLEFQALSNTTNRLEFKNQLKHIFKRFCCHKGVQLCLFERENHTFFTVDYHGELTAIMEDKRFSDSISDNAIHYYSGNNRDDLAKRLRFQSRHYRVPLFYHQELLGVIYMHASLPTHRTILSIIQGAAENALCNLLLKEKATFKDPMTQLDNKFLFAKSLERVIKKGQGYLAFIDIDELKSINQCLGHFHGDHTIVETAKQLQALFPKPTVKSIARLSGGEFCILFNASNNKEAYAYLEALRDTISQHDYSFEHQPLNITLSVGLTRITDCQQSSINRADFALDKAKQNGRNQVIMYAT